MGRYKRIPVDAGSKPSPTGIVFAANNFLNLIFRIQLPDISNIYHTERELKVANFRISIYTDI
jgi:hypothetical protein